MASKLSRFNRAYLQVGQQRHNQNETYEYVSQIKPYDDLVIAALRRNPKIQHIPRIAGVDMRYGTDSAAHGHSDSSSGLYKHPMRARREQAANDSSFRFEAATQKAIIQQASQKIPMNRMPASTKGIEFNLANGNLKETTYLIECFTQLVDFNIRDMSLNLSSNASIGDCEMINLINQIPCLNNLETLNLNLEATAITDHFLRAFAQACCHVAQLKSVDINLKRTSVIEKSVFSFMDALTEIGVDVEVDSEFGKPEDDMKLKGSKTAAKAAEKNQTKTGLQNSRAPADQPDQQASNNNNNSISSSNNTSNSSFQRMNSSNQMNIPPSVMGNVSNISNQANMASMNRGVSMQQSQQQQMNNPFQAAFSQQNNNSNQQQEEDVKRKSPEELAAEKNYEDGYGKGFKILMGLGFKVGKGLGKNDQGITEPVQALNKSKFKENNQNRSSSDYFENLQKQSNNQSNSMQSQQSAPQQQLQKMVKFEKKSTLVVNSNGSSNEPAEEETEPSPISTASNSKDEPQKSSQSKGSANDNSSPNSMYNNGQNKQSSTFAPNTAPFSTNIQQNNNGFNNNNSTSPFRPGGMQQQQNQQQQYQNMANNAALLKGGRML